MAAISRIALTNAGLIYNYSNQNQPDIVYISGSAITLAADVEISVSPLPPNGGTIIFLVVCYSLDLNGFHFQLNGVNIDQSQFDGAIMFLNTSLGTDWDTPIIAPSFDFSNPGAIINAAQFLLDASLTLAKFPTLPRGNLIAGNSSGRPANFAKGADTSFLQYNGTDLVANVPSGAVSVTNTGVFSIVAGYITNAMINAAAAIAWTKMAALTASQLVVTSAGGVITTVSSLSAALGGFGASMAAATGFTSWAGGTPTTGALTEVIRVDVSFLTAGQGTYYVAMPACTVTKVKARVTSVIAGTDDATIQCKDNGGTNFTAGLITIPASSAHGTGVSVTPSASNTFTAGQEMQLLVAKTTNGGLASVDITFTRTALT